jgi:hypothetical protein
MTLHLWEWASRSSLIDARRFARNFQDALRGMWQTWHDKQQR